MPEKEKEGLIKGIASGDPSSMDLFRTIFERIQTAIMVIDPTAHRIVDANPLMESLTGFSRDQMLGKGCQEFVCPAKCGECPVTDLRRNILNIEREVINTKGERVPVLKTVAKAEIGGKDYLIESFTDITDRVKAEERQLALTVFLSESILRAKKPLELMQKDFLQIAEQAKNGDYDAEDIRMQLVMHANNLAQILKNIEELQEKAVKGRSADIPREYREFFNRM
ncbi:PAS domain S-box protein [uncultured Methanoregula sp.]|uniref:PAS domain S-box protein n=1 Tax=uncultured Methanoregula sp. TaxID=1005933 RepID=UPI002AAAD6E3|nr:PAS domain S-box protein [uncultured Methanoregula sp.]